MAEEREGTVIGHRSRRPGRLAFALVVALSGLALPAPPVLAQEAAFSVPDAPRALRRELRGASLVLAALARRPVPAADVMAAARAEYGRLLGALYAAGYYGGTVSVRVDGREAADIPLVAEPARIARIEITVTPGPLYHFGTAGIGPLPPGTELPKQFAPGEPAPSAAIRDAAEAAALAWREAGHPHADLASQRIVADHANARIDASLTIDPGPRLSFGPLTVSGNVDVRTGRVHEITAIPEGEVYSDTEMRRAAARLRATGAFRSVSLREAEGGGRTGDFPVEVLVDEERPRRLGFGAELSSTEGATLSAFWLHRNLWGGAERFRIEGEVTGLGGETAGEDYRVGASLSRPATLTANTTLTLTAGAERLREPDYRLDAFEFGLGLGHSFSESLTGSLGLSYRHARTEDALGTRLFETVTLPGSLTWDRRDDRLNPTRRGYARIEAMPFLGLSDTGSGARVWADIRGYRPLGGGERLVAALRLQGGQVIGPALEDTPRDYLFHSGGGGTVRGQDYQSLGVTALPGGAASGGQVFAGAQAELRFALGGAFGLAAFYDVGYVAATGWGDAWADWHAGAGLGLRYNTGLGPIRLDVAAPVGGGGSGVQIYIGIGQAF